MYSKAAIEMLVYCPKPDTWNLAEKEPKKFACLPNQICLIFGESSATKCRDVGGRIELHVCESGRTQNASVPSSLRAADNFVT